MFKAKELNKLKANNWELIPGCSKYQTPKGTYRIEYYWHTDINREDDYIAICMFKGQCQYNGRDFHEWKYKPGELPLALKRWRQNTFRNYPTEALKVLELYAKEHGIN